MSTDRGVGTGGNASLHDPMKMKRLRTRAGLNQATAAERAGISPAHLCNIENGKTKRPGENVLASLARTYGCKVADFELDQEPSSLKARAAAHARWAQDVDRTEATAPARKAFLDQFERQVDPDGTLDPETRAKLATNARKAHFLGLALKSSRARSARKQDSVSDPAEAS